MKDPLQREQTAYEILAVPREAKGPDIDAAFKQGLVRRENVQKLTAAKRTLQQPLERALLDVFHYDPATLSGLAPNPLADPSCLLPRRRAQTAAAWEAISRSRFDLASTHALAVLWFWQALEEDAAGGGQAASIPRLREAWERAIAGWSMLLASDGFWKAWPAELRADLRRLVSERIRKRLHDREQAQRDAGADALARLYQELDLTFTTEERTAHEVGAAGFMTPSGRLACGRLMLQRLGALEMLRSHVEKALTSSPHDPELRALRTALSPYAPIRAQLDADDPEGAIAALRALPKPASEAPEVWELRAEAHHRLARHQASVDQINEALKNWEYALSCGHQGLERDICGALVEACQARAAALQRDRRRDAVALLERALKIVRSDTLQATLAELLTQEAIEAINAAQEGANTYTPALRAALDKGLSWLEKAAGFGSARAQEQLALVRGMHVRARWSQKTVRTVEFNSLPRAVRERFVRCATGKEQPTPVVMADGVTGIAGLVFGVFLLLGLLGLVVTAGFGDPNSGTLYHTAGFLGVYVVVFFLAVWSVLAAVRRRALIKGVPYPLHRYLFPLDVIDARDGTLKIWPMRQLADFKGTRHITNGVHTHTEINLKFEGGGKHSFTLPPGSADMDRLTIAEKKSTEALQNGDTHALACLDPLSDLTLGNVPPDRKPEDVKACKVRPLPAWFRYNPLFAAAAALVLMPPLWLVRNVASDLVYYEEASKQNTLDSLKGYVQRGWLRTAAAQARIPRLAYQAALRAGTVGAMREVLKQYPGSEVEAEARAALHAAYQKTLDAFRAEAAGDLQMVFLMGRLLAYLERSESAEFAVRFRPPSAGSLKRADAYLAGKRSELGRRVEPIAPHFDDTSALEGTIVQRLGAAFGSVFPADILSLRQGEALPGDLPGNSGPTLVIAYDVRPSGDFFLYSDPMAISGFGTDNRALYVGIRLLFGVSMHVPGEAQPFEFKLEVAPPEHFSVQSYSAGDPSASSVYSTMTERAFDQLSDKLRSVFFRKGSKAQQAGA